MTVASPLLTFAIQDTVTEQRAERTLEPFSFHVIGVILNQNVRDILRIIELVEVAVGSLPVDNITILIRDAFPES